MDYNTATVVLLPPSKNTTPNSITAATPSGTSSSLRQVFLSNDSHSCIPASHTGQAYRLCGSPLQELCDEGPATSSEALQTVFSQLEKILFAKKKRKQKKETEQQGIRNNKENVPGEGGGSSSSIAAGGNYRLQLAVLTRAFGGYIPYFTISPITFLHVQKHLDHEWAKEKAEKEGESVNEKGVEGNKATSLPHLSSAGTAVASTTTTRLTHKLQYTVLRGKLCEGNRLISIRLKRTSPPLPASGGKRESNSLRSSDHQNAVNKQHHQGGQHGDGHSSSLTSMSPPYLSPEYQHQISVQKPNVEWSLHVLRSYADVDVVVERLTTPSAPSHKTGTSNDSGASEQEVELAKSLAQLFKNWRDLRKKKKIMEHNVPIEQGLKKSVKEGDSHRESEEKEGETKKTNVVSANKGNASNSSFLKFLKQHLSQHRTPPYCRFRFMELVEVTEYGLSVPHDDDDGHSSSSFAGCWKLEKVLTKIHFSFKSKFVEVEKVEEEDEENNGQSSSVSSSCLHRRIYVEGQSHPGTTTDAYNPEVTTSPCFLLPTFMKSVFQALDSVSVIGVGEQLHADQQGIKKVGEEAKKTKSEDMNAATIPKFPFRSMNASMAYLAKQTIELQPLLGTPLAPQPQGALVVPLSVGYFSRKEFLAASPRGLRHNAPLQYPIYFFYKKEEDRGGDVNNITKNNNSRQRLLFSSQLTAVQRAEFLQSIRPVYLLTKNTNATQKRSEGQQKKKNYYSEKERKVQQYFSNNSNKFSSSSFLTVSFLLGVAHYVAQGDPDASFLTTSLWDPSLYLDGYSIQRSSSPRQSAGHPPSFLPKAPDAKKTRGYFSFLVDLQRLAEMGGGEDDGNAGGWRSDDNGIHLLETTEESSPKGSGIPKKRRAMGKFYLSLENGELYAEEFTQVRRSRITVVRPNCKNSLCVEMNQVTRLSSTANVPKEQQGELVGETGATKSEKNETIITTNGKNHHQQPCCHKLLRQAAQSFYQFWKSNKGFKTEFGGGGIQFEKIQLVQEKMWEWSQEEMMAHCLTLQEQVKRRPEKAAEKEIDQFMDDLANFDRSKKLFQEGGNRIGNDNKRRSSGGQKPMMKIRYVLKKHSNFSEKQGSSHHAVLLGAKFSSHLDILFEGEEEVDDVITTQSLSCDNGGCCSSLQKLILPPESHESIMAAEVLLLSTQDKENRGIEQDGMLQNMTTNTKNNDTEEASTDAEEDRDIIEAAEEDVSVLTSSTSCPSIFSSSPLLCVLERYLLPFLQFVLEPPVNFISSDREAVMFSSGAMFLRPEHISAPSIVSLETPASATLSNAAPASRFTRVKKLDGKPQEDVDRKAKEEADHKAKEEADRKAKEEADRKAKEEEAKEEQQRRQIEKQKADEEAEWESTLVIPPSLEIQMLLSEAVHEYCRMHRNCSLSRPSEDDIFLQHFLKCFPFWMKKISAPPFRASNVVDLVGLSYLSSSTPSTDVFATSNKTGEEENKKRGEAESISRQENRSVETHELVRKTRSPAAHDDNKENGSGTLGNQDPPLMMSSPSPCSLSCCSLWQLRHYLFQDLKMPPLLMECLLQMNPPRPSSSCGALNNDDGGKNSSNSAIFPPDDQSQKQQQKINSVVTTSSVMYILPFYSRMLWNWGAIFSDWHTLREEQKLSSEKVNDDEARKSTDENSVKRNVLISAAAGQQKKASHFEGMKESLQSLAKEATLKCLPSDGLLAVQVVLSPFLDNNDTNNHFEPETELHEDKRENKDNSEMQIEKQEGRRDEVISLRDFLYSTPSFGIAGGNKNSHTQRTPPPAVLMSQLSTEQLNAFVTKWLSTPSSSSSSLKKLLNFGVISIQENDNVLKGGVKGKAEEGKGKAILGDEKVGENDDASKATMIEERSSLLLDENTHLLLCRMDHLQESFQNNKNCEGISSSATLSNPDPQKDKKKNVSSYHPSSDGRMVQWLESQYPNGFFQPASAKIETASADDYNKVEKEIREEEKSSSSSSSSSWNDVDGSMSVSLLPISRIGCLVGNPITEASIADFGGYRNLSLAEGGGGAQETSSCWNQNKNTGTEKDGEWTSASAIIPLTTAPLRERAATPSSSHGTSDNLSSALFLHSEADMTRGTLMLMLPNAEDMNSANSKTTLTNFSSRWGSIPLFSAVTGKLISFSPTTLSSNNATNPLSVADDALSLSAQQQRINRRLPSTSRSLSNPNGSKHRPIVPLYEVLKRCKIRRL